jgi:hypothetical protein
MRLDRCQSRARCWFSIKATVCGPLRGDCVLKARVTRASNSDWHGPALHQPLPEPEIESRDLMVRRR